MTLDSNKNIKSRGEQKQCILYLLCLALFCMPRYAGYSDKFTRNFFFLVSERVFIQKLYAFCVDFIIIHTA